MRLRFGVRVASEARRHFPFLSKVTRNYSHQLNA
jgi:hypothetical protein